MTRSRSLSVVAVAILLVVVGGFVVYDQVLRGDNAAALALPTPSATAGDSASPPTSPPPAASSDPAPTAADGDVAGTWTVGSGSQAGYRVREELAGIGAESDAVGRTDQVSGSITLETSGAAVTLTAGDLTVDTTSITSDESRRDNRLRTDGLQTDTYPTATFSLTQPVDIPSAALAGSPADLTLVGDLTLHGVTRSVEIPAQAQLVDGTIQVAGAIGFPLADYSIVAPNVGGFIISIADSGSLEFLVNFSRS